MATIKKSKAKNISAGPSKKQPKAGLVDPKGQYTMVQKRTLGSMKTGGMVKKKVMKAQNGQTLPTVTVNAPAEKKRTLKDKIFGTKEERQEWKENRQANRDMRQTNRAVRRSERASMPRCNSRGCGGRAMGFGGFKTGGKVAKKK